MLQRHARTAERVGAFAPFSVPHFGKIYMGGMLWSVCRWGLGFLGAYFVNQRTHSPRLVQLTGTMMWAPLLFAGLIGGSLADRFDRRRIVLAQFSTLMPLVGLIGFASLTNHLEVWMIFPFQICIGVGWVIDMTARRALVYDLVGDQYVNGAMALEQFASSLGLAGGALAGGSIIGGLGIAWAYIAVAACMSVALLVLARLPAGISQQSAPRAAAVVRPTLRSTLTDGLRMLPSNPALVSVLGVTLIVNLFHFSYFPIVTVIAQRVFASPFLTGLLAAATGFGMATGALAVAVFQPSRGRVYVIGSFLGFGALVGFAEFRSYWAVVLSLYLASCGVGLYGAAQSALVLTATDEARRGRAMGLLSMAIGGLPVGMYLLGEAAQRVGAPTALLASNVAGAVVLILFLRRRPEVFHID